MKNFLIIFFCALSVIVNAQITGANKIKTNSATGIVTTTMDNIRFYTTTLNAANADSIQFNNTAGKNLFNIIRKENPYVNVGTAVTGAPYIRIGNPVLYNLGSAYATDNSAILIGRNVTGDGLFAHAIRDESYFTPTTSTSSAYASFDGIAQILH